MKTTILALLLLTATPSLNKNWPRFTTPKMIWHNLERKCYGILGGRIVWINFKQSECK